MFGLFLFFCWFGYVFVCSGSDGDCYVFMVEVSLLGIGCWIGYCGMLEIDDGI